LGQPTPPTFPQADAQSVLPLAFPLEPNPSSSLEPQPPIAACATPKKPVSKNAHGFFARIVSPIQQLACQRFRAGDRGGGVIESIRFRN